MGIWSLWPPHSFVIAFVAPSENTFADIVWSVLAGLGNVHNLLQPPHQRHVLEVHLMLLRYRVQVTPEIPPFHNTRSSEI